MTTDPTHRIVDAAATLVRSGTPFRELFDRVIALAAEELPSPAWEAIAGVDVGVDVDRTAAWFVRQLAERPPPDDVAALWFGLHQVRGPGPGKMEAVIAVTGAPGFGGPEWRKARSWEPPGYVPAAGLKSLLPLSVGGEPEARAVVATGVVLAYGLGFSAAVVESVGPERLLAGRSELAVATGFPDGDVVPVGTLTAAGLDRSSAAPAT